MKVGRPVEPRGRPHEHNSRQVRVVDFAVLKHLPKFDFHSNKSDHGKVLIIAGSTQYPGAGILAASSAARMGAGYVFLANFEDAYSHWLTAPEFLILPHTDLLSRAKLRSFDSIAVGPGLTVTQKLRDFLVFLKSARKSRVVLDADALNTWARFDLGKAPKDWVMTPHSGELARLLKIPAAKINSDRRAMLKRAHLKLGGVLVLKGYRTLIAHGKRLELVGSGNPSLGKAGSGDVLTGMIGGLMAQGSSSVKAAQLGCFLHGHMADCWIQSGLDELSLLPSDLREVLPHVLKELRTRIPV